MKQLAITESLLDIAVVGGACLIASSGIVHFVVIHVRVSVSVIVGEQLDAVRLAEERIIAFGVFSKRRFPVEAHAWREIIVRACPRSRRQK
jgi:hypothetical protein